MFIESCIWSTTSRQGISARACTNLVQYVFGLQPMALRSSKINWHPRQTMMVRSILQDMFCLSAGSVQYYFKQSVQLEDQFHQHCFACLRWNIPHAESLSLYGNPIKVYRNKFYQGGPSSFIPVQRLFSRFACVELEQEEQKLSVVSPLIRNVHL